ncbi:MAG: oligosaccharide flippase family protein, partial [Candidatus Bathyarchaeota archaeon]|nr:oligosaccharide flippase family protein [Candidatus Bathyarchaeota archaeon]
MKMGKDSATGSFQLFIGRIISTVMLAIGTIIVGMLIDQGEYGLYTIALIPATTFLLFQDWGVGSALTKYIANYRGAKREEDLRSVISSGLAFEVITGLTLTLLSLLTANLVASTILGNSEAAFLVTLVSITILFTAIYNGSLCVFIGFERMELSTVSMIIRAVVQGVLSPLLVFLGLGAVGVVVGFTAASIVSGVTSVALLYFAIFRKLPSGSINKAQMFKSLKPLLRYGIPLSIGTLIGGVLPQINSFVMASFTDIVAIGNLGIAKNFAIFLNFFILPINTVLFPAFSKLNPSKDKRLLKIVFKSSVKYFSLFLVPATMALMILSTPLINTIYGDKWATAPIFLTLAIIVRLL